MNDFFARWLQRWGRRNARVVDYRFGDAPTANEMAAYGAAACQSGVAREPAVASKAAGDDPLPRPQRLRLAQLIEECGEVQQAAAKVLAHGYLDRTRRGEGWPRRAALEREVGHLLATVRALEAAGDLRSGDVRGWKQRRVQEAPSTGQ